MRPEDLRAGPGSGSPRLTEAGSAEVPREPALAIAPHASGEETPRLDPARATGATVGAPPPTRQWMPFGMAGSLALHLLPVVVLLNWTSAPAKLAMPIPVQLVLETPPPPPPPSAPQKKPPPMARASVEMGEPAGQPEQSDAAAAPAAPEPPGETQIAAIPPPPAIAPEPTQAPRVEPPPRKPAAVRLPPNRNPSPRMARLPGPSAARDEYLAYCESLIRRHFDMLPASFIDGRRGATALSLIVLDDGTIASIRVARSSGYPDIDERIEQMVAAVRRFPPLPQWEQGPSIKLFYNHVFPDERER